jgi:DNA-binding MurR/RpiR family transcriptional regulator
MPNDMDNFIPLVQSQGAARPEMLSVIREKYDALSRSQQRIADYILTHAGEVIYLSITELAERAGVGEATVSRFCWILGLHGFQELKLSLAQDNANAPGAPKISREEAPVDNLTRLIADRISKVVDDTIQSIDEVTVDRACALLAGAHKIDFYGVGTSAVMAIDASQMFLGIGKITTAYVDPHIQVMSAALLTSKDVAVAFSHSGSTKDTVTALRRARESGARTICITSYERSPIAQVSDLILIASFGEKVVLTSVYSKIGEMVLLERLYLGTVQNMKEEAQAARLKITDAILDKMY